MCIKRIFALAGLLSVLTQTAARADGFEFSSKKEVNSSFSAGADDRLNIDNKYGSITVSHWGKNEVNIRVVVESKAASERVAQEMLEQVQIELHKQGNTVFGITSIRQYSGGTGSRSLAVNYFITMPAKLSATLSQIYGNINLPETNEGAYTVELKYGNLNGGNFAGHIALDAAYAGHIALGETKDLFMELKYCGHVSTGNCRNVAVDSKYSNIQMGHADHITLDNAQHGNVRIESAGSVHAEAKYANVRIGHLKESLFADALDYSSVTVEKVDADFKNITAEARYGTLSLSISPQASFRVEAEDMKYGKVEISGLQITDSRVENKTDYYYHIRGGQNKTIRFEGNHYSTLKINAL
jgi:hypothetical protein